MKRRRFLMDSSSVASLPRALLFAVVPSDKPDYHATTWKRALAIMHQLRINNPRLAQSSLLTFDKSATSAQQRSSPHRACFGLYPRLFGQIVFPLGRKV